MKPRRLFPPVISATFAQIFLLAILTLGAASARGQLVAPFIGFTKVWRYDHSGFELGAAWRTNDFDDAAWPVGPGLLGFEDVIAPYQIHVPTGLGTIIPISGSVTTFYFRTTFQFSGTTNFVQLFATNLVDDGCAIWLNGQLAGTVRLNSNGFFNAATFAQSGPTIEGQLDAVSLRNFLREGENQLAVEVHQSAATSADILFGMRLLAFTPTPLVITNQPDDLLVTLGDPVAFQVGVSGGPVNYRWQKDGVFLPNATNAIYNIQNATLGNTGSYRVICSNALTVVTSQTARLTVIQDLTGPRVIEAIADNGFGSNRIHVRFSEALLNTAPATPPYSPRNLTNYTVTRLGTGQTVEITNVQHSGTQVLLMLSANLVRYDDYSITINRVADRSTNSIAPDTTVPVSWVYRTNNLQFSSEWDFHASALFDPGVFDESWFEPGYTPGPWWGRGWAPFYGGILFGQICGSFDFPQNPIGWQPEPALFRATFQSPTNWPATATLRVRYAVDDALALYLNGIQIFRYNLAGALGDAIFPNARALTQRPDPICATNNSVVVTNLRPGLNTLAAAVAQSASTSDGDMLFALEIDAEVLIAPTLPAEPEAILQITSPNPNTARLSWNRGGYILESSTNLDSGPLSYPFGPWTPVPQLANPYHWPLTNDDARFFRLKK